MQHNTSQDLERSNGQEESKLGKINGFRIRQMQKGEDQDRNICQHLGQNRQGVSDSTLDSSPSKRCFNKAKILTNEASYLLHPKIPSWYHPRWNEVGPWRLGEPVAIFHWKV